MEKTKGYKFQGGMSKSGMETLWPKINSLKKSKEVHTTVAKRDAYSFADHVQT